MTIDREASESRGSRSVRWYRAMRGRDPGESWRGVSPLELFFDLCFVVAMVQTTTLLADSISAGQIVEGTVGYLTVFFSIWWAWMNFTWFASAFDNDDVPCRLAVFIQMTGALILAAGTTSAFREGDFATVFLGYAVMRAGLVSLWLRAAWSDAAHRVATLRYAVGLVGAMLGWSIMLITGEWPLWGLSVMVAVELLVPVWAESRGATPWNRFHVARRHDRFVIIVLGQSVLALTNAVRIAMAEQEAGASLYLMMGGGLLIMFCMWWLYFASSAPRFLDSNRRAFVWGYGHYFIFGAAAAVGAGIAVNVEQVVGNTGAGGSVISAAIAVPVAVYLLLVWLLHRRPERGLGRDIWVFPSALLVILASGATEWAVPVTGVAVTLLVVASVNDDVPRLSQQG